MEPTLLVDHLGVNYYTRKGNLSALRRISFSVAPGEIVGLVGESGCGKSTIALALMKLLPINAEISSGMFQLNGQDLTSLNETQMREIRGRDMSMIFQDPMTSLNPVYSIEKQMVDAILSHPGSGRPKNKKEAGDYAIQMLAHVGIPDASKRIKYYPHQFSGGMRQRVMIATALQSKPSLLIADEPTSALDVTLEAQVNELIIRLREEHQTSILYITHNLGVVSKLCDKVIVLYSGDIVESGDVRDIFRNPLHPYTKALLQAHPSRESKVERLRSIRGRVPDLTSLPSGCKFADRCELVQQACREAEVDVQQVEKRRVLCNIYKADWVVQPSKVEGTDLPRFSVIKEHKDYFTDEDPLVNITGLTTVFKGKSNFSNMITGTTAGSIRAVDDVSLKIYRGQTLVVVGESGSGKTTLGRSILRLEQSTVGAITVGGKSISALSQAKLRPLRAKMQMIFQDPVSSLSPRKTVTRLLLEPYAIHGIEADQQIKVPELLAMVGLSMEQADKFPHQLSGGQARRVGIARALALSPELLIADEPTAGLDVSVAAEVLNLLKDLREKLSLTYIVITHDLSITSFIADLVMVMYLGKIVEIGSRDEVFNNPCHPYSEALLSVVSTLDPDLYKRKKNIILEGEIPSPLNPPTGCYFHTRCRYKKDLCTLKEPFLSSKSEHSNQKFACHYPL